VWVCLRKGKRREYSRIKGQEVLIRHNEILYCALDPKCSFNGVRIGAQSEHANGSFDIGFFDSKNCYQNGGHKGKLGWWCLLINGLEIDVGSWCSSDGVDHD